MSIKSITIYCEAAGLNCALALSFTYSLIPFLNWLSTPAPGTACLYIYPSFLKNY
jgi:hypothetical protein